MKRIKQIISLLPILCVSIFLSSCHNPENDLRQKIEESDTITKADIKVLDELFYQFNPLEYPNIDYNDCSNIEFIQRKIDYIKKVKPKLSKIFYQDFINDCNKIEPDFINIFLETSASMKGYYACPVFTGASSIRIPDYGEKGKINCYLYSNTLSTKMDYDLFSEKLSKNQIQTGLDSKFDKMFDKIIGLTPKNSLSFFITDAVIAAGNKEIRTETPEGLLRIYQNMLDNIRDNIRDAKKKNPDFAVSVYRFKGNFNGIYYDSNDKPQKLINKQRPFFIFVLGDKRITDDFRKKVNAGNELPKFKPSEQIHFNGDSNPFFDFTSDQIGTADDKVQEGVIKEGDPVQLTVILRNFPEYILNKEYIKNNCHVTNAYGEKLNMTEVRDRNFTLTLESQNLSGENAVTVKIDMTQLPEWCSEISTKDDKKTDTDTLLIGKTFYIEELIKSIRAGITGQATIENTYKFTK
jgi:REP element-mobilizing transposase RayT